ncbi:MAG: ribonuclease HII [Candidatus Omnitrophica bacterium]|nr:ribonuclease HII [Candidatus Omnitrophota bacterium]
MKRKGPADLFEFERSLLLRGISCIAGVDEAGRGPLAGPVLAAAVVLPAEWITGSLPGELRGLTDSKQLTAPQRDGFFAALTHSDQVQYALGSSDVECIDQFNILQGTYRAMRQALSQLRPPPMHVLVDGRFVPALPFPQTPLVKGDARSYSIAAASVLAKVTRDRIMIDLDRRYPVYGFAEHKGYATPRHLAALAQFGPCPCHRHSFAPIKASFRDLF